ncbi:MAG: HDOD domain-containing protein, partial [Nitrospirae bacterium]
ALEETGDKRLGEEALLAGLLHDVGKLILQVNLPEAYGEARRRAAAGEGLLEVEGELFGTTHAEVGAYLLGLWGLPDAIVEAVAFHHRPGECPSDRVTPLALVHAANCLEAATPAESPARCAGEVDTAYLEAAGLGERLEAWTAIAAEVSAGAEEARA